MNARITENGNTKWYNEPNAAQNLKAKTAQLERLLVDLNSLSCKHYEYVYKYGDKHYIYYRIGYSRFMFRYADRIEDLIKIVEILIRYRTIEYEEEYEDDI